MQTDIFGLSADVSRMAGRVFRIWKSVSDPMQAPHGLCPVADLERLALTSPHLLADLGFARDATGSTPGMTVWRRGQRTVVVTQSAAVSAG